MIGQNISLFVAREPNVREDAAEGYKGYVVFSELRDCVYKGSQGFARHFGSQNK